MRRSVFGLLDPTLPQAEQEAIKQALGRYEREGVRYHALRTRYAGTRSFVSFHVLVPGDWTVQRGHDPARTDRTRYPRGGAECHCIHSPGTHW